MKESWPPERIEELRAMIADGVPYAEIGKCMGLSKNAVLGKGHRLGFGTARPVREIIEDRVLFPDKGNCLYPIGHPDREEFRFCGATVRKDGEPYCEKHHAICLVPVNANALKQINFAAGKLGKTGGA